MSCGRSTESLVAEVRQNYLRGLSKDCDRFVGAAVARREKARKDHPADCECDLCFRWWEEPKDDQ